MQAPQPAKPKTKSAPKEMLQDSQVRSATARARLNGAKTSAARMCARGPARAGAGLDLGGAGDDDMPAGGLDEYLPNHI
jgi:hypothetical protein